MGEYSERIFLENQAHLFRGIEGFIQFIFQKSQIGGQDNYVMV